MNNEIKNGHDAVLRNFIGYRLKRAMNIFSANLANVLRPYDLRMITFSTLATVIHSPGIRLSQLSEVLAVERPNLVAIVDELQKRGLIERKRDQQDRRAFGLFPTETGSKLIHEALHQVDVSEAKILASLSQDDIAQLTQLLTRIETSV
jgi:DNA-binding MarR family transcriptional regulator